jgi:hypothetical protein
VIGISYNGKYLTVDRQWLNQWLPSALHNAPLFMFSLSKELEAKLDDFVY